MKKYKVSQELMNEIDEWRDRADGLVVSRDLTVSSDVLPSAVKDWWLKGVEWASEKNNRLIALIRYVNGEDVFEVEKPKKWFVRSKESELNGYGWLSVIDKYQTPIYQYSENIPFGGAVCFDSKEEAEKWKNPLTEVVLLPIEGDD